MTSKRNVQFINLALCGIMWFNAFRLGVNAWKSYGYATALSTPYEVAQFKPGFLHTMWFSVIVGVVFLVLPVVWHIRERQKGRPTSLAGQEVQWDEAGVWPPAPKR